LIQQEARPPYSENVCRLTGLPVVDRFQFVSQRPESDFRIEALLLGERLVVVRGGGYAVFSDMRDGLEQLEPWIKDICRRHPGVVYIEDYTAARGADFKARNCYNRFGKRMSMLRAGILFGVPSIFRFSFKLSHRLHVFPMPIHMAANYADAVKIAENLAVSDQRGAGVVPQDDRPKRSNLKDRLAEWAGRLRPKKNTRTIDPARLDRRIQDLLGFIACIDWSQEGYRDYAHDVPPNDPLRPIFDAVAYLKDELDLLFRERKQAEDALKASESRYRLLVQQARAGICQVQVDTRTFINVNEVMTQTSGYDRSELLSLDIRELVAESSRPAFDRVWSGAISGVIESDRAELEIHTKDGRLVWVDAAFSVTLDQDRPREATVVVVDISQRKKQEKELVRHQNQLRVLAAELARAEERERRRLASHLHDHISQELAAVSIRLGLLESKTPSRETRGSLAELRSTVQGVITESRSLTLELSPPILYELGFAAAVDWLAERTENTHDLDVEVQATGQPARLPEDVQIVLFRGLSELFHNVVKHGRAQRIRVNLAWRPDRLNVRVADDGVGFDPAGLPAAHGARGFGLFNLRERLTYLGGDLRIESAPGQGAALTMSAPLAPPAR
jgi:PAS domain S-box-containing protein